jgi:hypothetical protein
VSPERTYRAVGGPLDGQLITTAAQKVTFEGEPGMAYHRTRPTDSDWRDRYGDDWYIHGKEPPPAPDHVMEWHDEDWQSPEVAAIRAAVRDAVTRETPEP